MKLDELKKIIRECIREEILNTSGLISHIISESMVAVMKNQPKMVVESAQPEKPQPMFKQQKTGPGLSGQEKQKLNETKKKLLDAIGKDSYGGVDVFAGTTPLSSGGDPEAGVAVQSPLSNVDPNDPGVPVEQLFENAHLWGKIAAGISKKKK